MFQKLSRKEILLAVASTLLLVTCIALIVVLAVNLKPDDPVEPTMLTARMEIIRGADYIEALTNSSTPQFKSLAFDVENLVSEAYSYTELRLLFKSSEVLSFSKAQYRLAVIFDLWFNQPVNPDEARQELSSGLYEVSNRKLVIAHNSIWIGDKEDLTTPVPTTTTTTEITCPNQYVKCADKLRCIPPYSLCDGLADCVDASDEDPGSCATLCDGQFELQGPNGSFSSLYTYTDSTPICRWIIRVERDFSIEVNVQFETERTGTLDFYEGVGRDKPETASAASLFPTWTVWLLSDQATVELRPDFLNTSSGFNATYKAVNLSNLSNEEKITCNFEQGMCFWRQTYKDDGDWQRWQNTNDQLATGPSGDHTLGNSSGSFIITQLTRPTSPISYKIHSLPLSRTEEPMCLSFWYNMNGVDVYRLNVRLQQTSSTTGTVVFQKEGNYGDNWNYGQVTLYLATELTVVFEAVMNRGLLNRIALDDIALTAGPCGPAPTEPTNVPVTATPPAASTVTSP